MLITAAAIVLFTALAGMVSIVSVDVFNGIAILAGILIVVGVAVLSLVGTLLVAAAG